MFVKHIWSSSSKLRSLLINLCISGFSLLLVLIILELIFYAFFIRSDGFGFTLASKRWMAKYWRLYRSRFAKEMGDAYFDYLSEAYSDRRTWTLHQKELVKITEFARANHIDLIVIVFPRLSDVGGSRQFTAKVADFMRSNGVTVIDLAPLFIHKEPVDLMINASDGHPNVELNREVGNLLSQEITHLARYGLRGHKPEWSPK